MMEPNEPTKEPLDHYDELVRMVLALETHKVELVNRKQKFAEFMKLGEDFNSILLNYDVPMSDEAQKQARLNEEAALRALFKTDEE